MGLDVTHDCFHGAYSSFSRWRNALAVAAGYKIEQPPADDIFTGRAVPISPYIDIDWNAYETKNYYGEWDRPPGDDPLLYLIVHSDCDGVIHPKEGVHIARRLRQLTPLLPEEGTGHLARYGLRGVTERFAAGLEAAASRGEDVEFL